MKIQKVTFLYTTVLILSILSVQASSSSILINLAPYPQVMVENTATKSEEYSNILTQPGYITKSIISKQQFPWYIQGIAATYLGYSSISNYYGQIIFPRKHITPIVKVLITKSIQPVYMIAPATVHNWMLDKHAHADFYTIQFHKDNETNVYYTTVAKTPLPENNMIPLDTIIIFAQPEDIFVPVGATITYYSSNFILPTFYVRNSMNTAWNALYMQSLRSYFEPMTFTSKQNPLNFSKIITNS